jgi:hypothetical protein
MKSTNLEWIVFVKKIYTIELLLLLTLLGMLFGFVPKSHAQSVQEWAEPINLSMSGAATNPSIVVDSNGVLHVIWVDQFDGFKYAQSEDGITWTDPMTVRFPFSTRAAPPFLLADPSGKIHIFWLSEQNKLIYAQTLNNNLDTPPAWRTRIDMDSPVYDFDASLDAQGRLHVSYVKNPAPVAGTAGAFYRRSANGGSTWSGPKLLYESRYFRSLTSENARIRMAVSDHPEEERVYIVWDDRPQKRIFIATSEDGGLNWGPIKEMVAPQANLGFRSPINADIDVLNDKVLATWQVGETGGRCTPYSWSSSDGGETWGEQVRILSESAQCPERAEFIPIDPGYSVSLFTIQGNLSISAWNGTAWSDPEIQAGPSSITNPATFDTVLLGCQQAVSYNDRLFVVGCDQGAGGDIWFVARQLDPLEELFPLPSDWSGDANVITVPRSLESLSTVPDADGNVHAVWIQSSYLPTDTFAPRIEYARWNGTEWTRPSPIITNLSGMPKNLALQIDSNRRLFLSWVNQQTGELMFTWSSSERANIPLEWTRPIILSASSKSTGSPDMLVDAADRVVIAYAVSLNEERGIYVIQSSDQGETWSSPVKVFDAVSENWEMVDQPKLAVGRDGRLHVLFMQYALLGQPQPVGLYYSQSEDGGVTWTPPEIISEQPVQWSEIVAYQETLHRFWQEKSRTAAQTNHQTSLDGGMTWSSTVKIPGDAVMDSQPSISVDPTGTIHFLQVIKQDNQILQEWEWSEGRWRLSETRKVSALELNSPARVEGGVTSDGSIYALLQFERLLDNGIETSVLNINRSLEITEPVRPFLASISTPSTSSIPTPNAELEPTPTQPSPLADLTDPQPGVNKNLIGLTLIASVLLFILIITVPRRNKVPDETKRSK